jgi:hypothetical protein
MLGLEGIATDALVTRAREIDSCRSTRTLWAQELKAQAWPNTTTHPYHP